MNFNKNTFWKNIQKIFYLLICSLSLFVAISAPLIQAYADDSDNGKSKVEDAYGSYAGSSKQTYEVLGKYSDEKDPDTRKDSLVYLLSRIFVPQYINNVKSGYVASDLKNNDPRDKSGNICNAKSPQNLISYNCDIPNISAQIIQAFMRTISPGGVANANRTSAQAAFGFGVPSGIPTGSVPVDESQRTHKYTGLELFGYTFNYTNYNGEWDDIIPSTRARLLANMGTIDKINLTGDSIFNGLKAGASTFVSNLSWKPSSWLANIENTFDAATSSTFLTIVDTSDLNIATSRAWVRSGSSVENSFYNVYVLSDKQVEEAGVNQVAIEFVKKFNLLINSDPRVKAVFAMRKVPVFKFNPKLESDASKKARAAAESKNKEIDSENAAAKAWNKANPDKTQKTIRSHVTVPAKKYVPESTQFADWKKSNSSVQKGKNEGIDCTASTNYNAFQTCWSDKWTSYAKDKLDANNIITSSIIKTVEKQVMEDNDHYDPTKAISHYVCADSKGNIKYNKDGEYEYVYLQENNGSKQYLNPNCSPVRPTIYGGFLDKENSNSSTNDTRHSAMTKVNFLSTLLPILGDLSKDVQQFAQTISRTLAQILNEFLNLAFAPIMDKLGVTTIVETVTETFRDTIFYPLVSLVLGMGALLVFIDVLKTHQLIKFFSTLLIFFITFMASIVLLNNPKKVINEAEEVPSYIENIVLNAMLNNSNNDAICSSGSSGVNTGVRSSQCYIWKTLLFDPWVYGQFGTGYNQLYAKGHAAQNGSAMKNKNTSLVGNAAVNMGGGTTVYNWALYQLKTITSGTITTQDTSRPVGTIDTNVYRLVDLQAGPNNGADSDSRYFSNWSGVGDSRTIVSLLSAFVGIVMFVAVAGLLLTKIELTFLMSIYLIAFPIMLLFGLTPKGSIKLKNYIFTLFGFMLQRILITIMLGVLLKLLDGITASNMSNYYAVTVANLAILGFFIVYKPHIMALFKLDTENPLATGSSMGNTSSSIREMFSKYTPRTVKNMAVGKAREARGFIAGTIGGALGGTIGQYKELSKNDKLENDKLARPKDENVINRLVRNTKNIVPNAKKSASHIRPALENGMRNVRLGQQNAMGLERRRYDNYVTRKGLLTSFNTMGRVKQELQNEGKRNILNNKGQDKLTNELYKNALNESKYGKYSVKRQLSNEEREALNSPELQRKLRKQSGIILDDLHKDNLSQDYAVHEKNAKNVATDAAKLFDKEQMKQANKGKILHPGRTKADIEKLTAKAIEKETKVPTDVNNIKQNIEKIPKIKAENENKKAYKKKNNKDE